MSKTVIEEATVALVLNALEPFITPNWAGRGVDEANAAYTALQGALAKQAAPVQQEPVAWGPYLSDRADGVSGHYAIARWNPRGYREVWNLRRHAWGAYSDDVLSLEEADTLLRLIEIPTRKVETTKPAQQEPVAWGIIASNTGRICQVELDADEVEGHNPKHIVPLCRCSQAPKENQS